MMSFRSSIRSANDKTRQVKREEARYVNVGKHTNDATLAEQEEAHGKSMLEREHERIAPFKQGTSGNQTKGRGPRSETNPKTDKTFDFTDRSMLTAYIDDSKEK